MAEFNPYKLEEEKWTPKNVYEILPPNSVSWSDYDFGQGTDNVDGEAAKKSFIDGFVDFFKDLFGVAGQILGGALELGGAILGGFVEGVVSFVGGIANAIGSIFGGGSGESPNLPLFNPIKTNLEAAIQPHRDKINESWQKTEEILAEQEVLRGQMADSLDEMRDASSRAQEASERSGLAIERAEAASAAAREARETLEEYNEKLTKQIREEFNAAVGRAETAIEKAEAANAELVTMNTQLGEITQQTSDINDKLEEHNQRFTDGLATASSAIDEAVSITAAVKALAEENQAKVDDAVSKAEKATSDLATLTPKVTDAVNKASKASSDVSALTPKVDDAAAKAAKAATDVGALTPKVTAAQEKANKAASDLSTLTPKVTAAQSRADAAYSEAGKVRNEVTPKIEDAQTKGESALAVADTAIDWLKNPVEIGTSVIAVDPETKRPYYAINMELVDDNPPGTSGPTYMSPASVSTPATTGPHVPVDPKIKYTVSFWAKADKPGSKIYGQFRNQTESNLAPDGTPMSKGAINISNPPQPSNKDADGKYVHGAAANSYFIQELELQTKWTYYEHEIQFAEGVTSVRVSSMYWSHSRGVPADQYISGLDIRPQIPTQASVDQAQNDAIRANSEILRQQGEINEAQRVANLAQDNFNDNQIKWNTASENATKALADADKAQKDINAEQKKFNDFQSDLNVKQKKWNQAVDRSLETQKTVNDNFKIWSDGATAAIEANTTALALLNNPQAGASLVVTDPTTKRPNWAEKLVEATAAENPDNLPDAYKAVPNTGSNTAKNMFVNIDPTTEYMVSLWVKANKTGSNMTYDMRDQTGNLAFVKSRAVEGFLNAGDNYRPYWIKNVPTKWTQYRAIVTPRETARKVRFGAAYFQHNGGTTTDATQYIADFQIYPLVPSQAQVDDAQNKAIQANKDLLVEQERINKEQEKLNKLSEDFETEQKKINNKQTGINALNTKADESLLQGLKALGKKSLGVSLVPYQVPSDQEVKDYAAGKLDYDPWSRPEYFAAGHTVLKSSTKSYAPTANDSQGQVNFQGTPVKVDSSIGYKVKFDTYAGRAGSRIFWYMYNQNNGNCLDYTPFADSATTGGRGLIHGLTIPSGWKTWEGVVHFTPETEEVKLWTLFWNHPTGVASRQYITNLEIVPEIPSQAVVDELQDNAIRENTRIGKENNTAIKALEDGLEAAIELGSAQSEIEALEEALGKEEKARSALQEKVDALQNEMIPRTIVSDDRVLYDDYVTLSGTKVTAKTGWSGQMAVTYIERTGHGSSSTPYVYKTRVTRKSVPDGTTREWSFPSGIERVDYWVYQGRPRTILLANAGPYITGKTFSSGTWGVLATHKVGKTYGTGKIEWRANLQYADRGVTYRFKIEVNGAEIKNYKWSGVGPLTSLGSGKKTLRFEHEFSLPDDATVRVLGYAYNSNSQQARVSLLQGTLHYTQDTAREG